MKIPPFFIGLTLLFWGYEKNQLLLGSIAFICIEAARFTKKRWKFSLEDFIKISDLSSVILISTIALILMNYESRYFLKITVQWLPLICLPLILAQTYSTGNTVVIGTRIGSKKREHAVVKHHMHRPMDFRLLYFVITLLAAATVNSRHEEFFPILFILTAWLLYYNRGQAFTKSRFYLVILIAAIVAFTGIRGLDRTHAYINDIAMDFWQEYYDSKGADPFKSHTAFGDVGRLKLSGKIVMRLSTDDAPPALLKEAGYNVFSKSSWFNRDREFTILPYNLKTGWQIVEQPSTGAQKVRIEKYFRKNKGLIPHPYGTEQIDNLNITDLSRNIEGTLRFEEGEILQKYTLSFNEQNVQTTQASEYHLQIPKDEKAALKIIIDSLNTGSLTDIEILNKIQRFFRDNFAYTLTTKGKGEMATPLANFLLKRRAGHCELFATATALLLREAGIPSRYITGFAVAEKSLLEQKYIIRSRHAHVWTEAFIDEQWLIIDTTPSRWLLDDERSASFFEPVRDFFSFLKHQINLFKTREKDGGNTFLSIVVILLTSFLIFRIYRRLDKKQSDTKQQELTIFPLQNSPFLLIEDTLNKDGIGRMDNEPFALWMQRIEAMGELDTAPLYVLYDLHQQFRFDPAGMPENKKTKLENGIREWLDLNRGSLG